MSMIANLLRKAYICIDSGNFQDARAILNSLLNLDPTNIEIWEIIMQISETCEDLDLLCERALQSADLDPTDRKSLIDYYYFLRNKLKYNGTGADSQKMVTFELVNQFTYTLKEPAQVNSAKAVGTVNGGQNIAKILGPAITVMYLILFVIGLVLISFGNNFGYSIVMILILGIAVVLRNAILTNQTQSVPQPDAIDSYADTSSNPSNPF